MKLFIIAAAIIIIVLCIAYTGIVLVWKIIQKHTPCEIVVGQVRWIQKSKIPGFKQVLFSYTKRGKTCEVVTRPMWYKKKFKLKGMYKIRVFYRKAGGKGTAVWADPVSLNRVSKR